MALSTLPLAAATRLLMMILLVFGVSTGATLSDAGKRIPVNLLQGEVRALTPTESAPPAASQTRFKAADGSYLTLEALAGDWRLVNLWATWCAPCREEIPSLDHLAAFYVDAPFQVITIASGGHDPGEIKRFMNETGIRLLPGYRSPDSAIARDLAVLGLPTSVLIDPTGHEVARLTGSADWFSDDAKAVIDYLLNQSPDP